MICEDCGKSGSGDCSVTCMHKKLSAIYPKIEAYESRAKLWLVARNAGVITDAQYIKARVYFGTLWNYIGD